MSIELGQLYAAGNNNLGNQSSNLTARTPIFPEEMELRISQLQGDLQSNYRVELEEKLRLVQER